MATLGTLIENLRNTGALTKLIRNPLAQFWQGSRPYVGATILPELTVPLNMYEEAGVKFRTVVAPDMDFYSPTPLRQGELISNFMIKLGTTGIKRQMTSEIYDKLIDLFQSSGDMPAMAAAINWFDMVVIQALLDAAERQRWEAIVDGSVVRKGDNGYTETITYPNPAGHRAAQVAAWSTDSTDIFDNIHAMADVMKGKGFTVGRIITSSNVVSIMTGNNTVKSRGGIAVVNSSGQITSAAGRASLGSINDILSRDGLPNIETYDLRFSTQTATKRFLKNDVMVLLAETERDPRLDFGDTQDISTPALGSTLGYHAVGRPAGRASVGRYASAEYFENTPPRIEGEGVMVHLPVILQSEAMAVITGIS